MEGGEERDKEKEQEEEEGRKEGRTIISSVMRRFEAMTALYRAGEKVSLVSALLRHPSLPTRFDSGKEEESERKEGRETHAE